MRTVSRNYIKNFPLQKTGRGFEIDKKHACYVFRHNEKECLVSCINSSTYKDGSEKVKELINKQYFIDNFDKFSQDIFDQVEDSGLFDEDELTEIALSSFEDWSSSFLLIVDLI